jgi:protein TonB
MFEDSLFASARKAETTKPVTVAISLLLQSFAVGIMVLIPLVYTEALPARRMIGILVTPPTPAPRPIAVDSPTVLVRTKPIFQQQEMTQPTRIPKRAAILHEDPLPLIVSGVVTDQPTLVSDAPVGLLSTAIETPPPPVTKETLERIQVGGLVAAARLIYQPRPVYPESARRFRIQGTVRLQALISKEGTIENLKVIDGHPMLIPASLEAVRQWRYEPTLLNGMPVEVETTIDVTFRFGG